MLELLTETSNLTAFWLEPVTVFGSLHLFDGAFNSSCAVRWNCTDGQRIVTGSADTTVRVWEAASAEQVARWQQEDRTIAAVEKEPAVSR